MTQKPNYIPKPKLDIPKSISETPKPNIGDYKVEPEQPQSTTVKVVGKKQSFFQRLITWLLSRNKGKIIAYLIMALRQIIYPFDVYKVDEKGNWEIDQNEQAIKNVPWASYIAKGGSLVTFAIAYFFNEPIKDFTGKSVVEWFALLLN